MIRGPEDSPYEGGEYHGKVIFPQSYPFAPPSIKMLTPNGRFQTDFRLCLSMSDYHPGTWNPGWSVATILTGLLSFMLENSPTTGAIITTDMEKQVYAKNSRKWNLNQPKFREIWPELLESPVIISNSIRSPIAEAKLKSPKDITTDKPSVKISKIRSSSISGLSSTTTSSPLDKSIRSSKNTTPASANIPTPSTSDLAGIKRRQRHANDKKEGNEALNEDNKNGFIKKNTGIQGYKGNSGRLVGVFVIGVLLFMVYSKVAARIGV